MKRTTELLKVEFFGHDYFKVALNLCLCITLFSLFLNSILSFEVTVVSYLAWYVVNFNPVKIKKKVEQIDEN